MKNTVFTLLGVGNTPTLTSSKRTQNRNTPSATEARVVRQTHSGFYWWAKCRCIRKCVVKVALKRAQLRVRACTDRLLIKPCDHPASSIRPRICSVGRTMTPSQLQDTTKMRSQQGQKDQTNESSGLYHLGRSGSHLYRVQSCPKAGS